MKSKLLFLLLTFVLVSSSSAILLAAGSSGSNQMIIRIGIFDRVNSVNISGEGGIIVSGADGGRQVGLSGGSVYLVTASGGNIIIKNKSRGKQVSISSASGKHKIRVNGRKYRGSIRIVVTKDKKLTVINKLNLEEYLYGVLPREISPDWPVEAMKTQAIVSRTYAVRNMGKHASRGYDLSATVFCQVYGGMECEDVRSNRAVNDTNGQVIKYRDELISSVFHSTCGGFTEKVSNVWESNAPPKYLKCVRCPYCRKSPRYNWETRIKKETIRKKLNKKGYKVGVVRQVKVAGRASFSKRALNFNVYHSGGKLSIQSNKFRLAVGADVLRSTMLKLKNYKDDIKFVGRGWGHAVGLCQWGAKGMAEKGYGYRRIIRKYFPGTKISRI